MFAKTAFASLTLCIVALGLIHLRLRGVLFRLGGIVTASSGFQVGSAATIHSTGQINSTNIVVSAGSSIGIGTDRPDTLLHVYKSGVHGGTHAHTDAPLLVENNGNCVIDIASIHTGIGGVYFSDTGASGKGKIEYKHGDDYMTFGVNGSERARIDSSGNVLIATTSATSELTVRGGGTVAAFEGTGGSGAIMLTDVDNSKLLFLQNADGVFNVQTNGSSYATKLAVTEAGLVNIGLPAAVTQSRNLNIGSDSEANLAIETHNDATSELFNLMYVHICDDI